ncbi:hypothetical protein [Streptomyces sp. NPDC014676]|uniref:hypothetical protein n=1 Tax=Streptomyces sp. NPDC014676 TaxID=3364879 RepID=UPI0036F52309
MSDDRPGPSPVIAEQPGPVLSATVSGAHLHGFPSRGLDVEGPHGVPDEARAASALPDSPTAYDAPRGLVVRTRPEG